MFVERSAKIVKQRNSAFVFRNMSDHMELKRKHVYVSQVARYLFRDRFQFLNVLFQIEPKIVGPVTAHGLNTENLTKFVNAFYEPL